MVNLVDDSERDPADNNTRLAKIGAGTSHARGADAGQSVCLRGERGGNSVTVIKINDRRGDVLGDSGRSVEHRG